MSNILPKETFIRQTLITGLIACIFVLALWGIVYHQLPPQVPLLYSNPWGKEQLVSPYILPLPIVLAVVFLVINILLAQHLFNTHTFVRQIFFIGAALTLWLSAITTLRIILLIR